MPTAKQVTEWFEIAPALLRGEGLQPYVEGEIAILFDWVEDTNAGSIHLMPYKGQFLVDVVQIDDNAVHQPSKPGDEVVVVLNGTLSLTTDATKQEQLIEAGSAVLIPAGWAGIYRVKGGRGKFLELAIVPSDYFDTGAAPPANALSPRPLELPPSPGRHELHRNRYIVEAENAEQATSRTIDGASDEVIRVLAGTLILTSATQAKEFGAGSVIVLPRGFQGEAKLSSDYRGFNARWLVGK